MNTRITILLVLAFLHRSLSAQTITYEWPGALGSISIYPTATDPNFMGTAPEWEQVNACTMIDQGRSVLQSDGWPTTPGKSCLRFHVLAFAPYDLDSIIIDHKRVKNGPDRFRVVLACGELCPERILLDTVLPSIQNTIAVKLNEHMAPMDGMEYGWVTLKLIPYGEGEGAWQPSSVRLIASPSMEQPPPADQQRMAQMPKRSEERSAPKPTERKRVP